MESVFVKLRIEGLHHSSDVEIDFDKSLTVFMGPNGIGKSTMLNILVHFLSRQWHRLAKQPFISASIEFASGDVATVRRSDTTDFVPPDMPTRYQNILQDVIAAGALELILTGDFENAGPIIFHDSEYDIGPRDLRVLRNALTSAGQTNQTLKSLILASNIITGNFSRQLIYLPTYRRIEQDISEVLSLSPLTQRRLEREISEIRASRKSDYTEIVQFGMDDIRSRLDTHSAEIKEYSRQQINSLSTRYLTAGLETKQKSIDRSFFNSLKETRVKDVLARVDDAELNAGQREALIKLLDSIKAKRGAGRLAQPQEHVARYFQMLAETHDRISSREVPLQNLARVLNKYIGPSKRAVYDQTRYRFVVLAGSREIPLSGLSSGEKQIVSLFTTLMLQEKEFCIFIDEPELSLSVLWQELLLQDIQSISFCRELLAVTHSPFIYGKKLAQFTRDLSDFIHPSQS